MEDTLLFIDLEGTVYTREKVVDGVPEALKELRSLGATLRFLTNTDSASTKSILTRVLAMGLEVYDGELFTPVAAAKALLKDIPEALVFPLTTKSVADELSQTLSLTDYPDMATHVIVGDIRRSLSYTLLNTAFSSDSQWCPDRCSPARTVLSFGWSPPT